MLDIILLIFLCRKIGTTAESKGLSPGRWKFYTVLAWFGFEILGMIIGIALFGFNKENLFPLLLFAVACAFGGYLFVKATLEKKPDQFDDEEIENIGRDNINNN